MLILTDRQGHGAEITNQLTTAADGSRFGCNVRCIDDSVIERSAVGGDADVL